MVYFTGLFSFPVGNVDVTDPWQNDEKRNVKHTIQLMIEDLFMSIKLVYNHRDRNFGSSRQIV